MSIKIKSFENSCPICYEEYKTSDSLLVFPCGHFGHFDCFDQCNDSIGYCPICRQKPTKKCYNCCSDIFVFNKAHLCCYDCYETMVSYCQDCHRTLRNVDGTVRCSDCFIQTEKYQDHFDSYFGAEFMEKISNDGTDD